MTPLAKPEADVARSTCPACKNDVLSVHGIETCSTCSWVTPEHR
ncbi:hypothetical protein [Haloplanus sp. C73]